MGTSPCLTTILQRETIFITSCLLSRAPNSFQIGVYSYRKEFATMGANSFFSEWTTFRRDSRYKENGRVAAPKSVPINLIELIMALSSTAHHICGSVVTMTL